MAVFLLMGCQTTDTTPKDISSPAEVETTQKEEETPELFNSDDGLEVENNEQEFSSFTKEKNHDEDEDDLEIPAFLRRQKN